MSNLLNTYAQTTGLKPSEPYVREVFFPLPFEQYITVHNSSGQEGKNYDYWHQVVQLIAPHLAAQDIKILQIGTDKDSAIDSCIHLQGATNLGQTAYLLKRSQLHLSNDTFSAHMAAWFGVPQVSLYGSTTVENHAPALEWRTNQKSVFIESDRAGKLPTFQAKESPKTINMIKPECVAQHALDILGIDVFLPIETVLIQPKFRQNLMEFDNTFVMSPEEYKTNIFNLRFDLNSDEQMLAANLSLRKYYLLTDRKINSEILKKFKTNIGVVAFDVKQSNVDECLQGIIDAKNQGLSVVAVTFEDEDWLNSQKLKFADYCVVQKQPEFSKDVLADHYDGEISELFFKTNRYLASDFKFYASHSHKKANIELQGTSISENCQKVIDEDLFWKETESHWYFKIKQPE